MKFRHLPHELWVLFAAILVNRMGNFVFPFLALYLTIHAGWGPAQVGLFLMVLPLAVVPGQWAGGWLADHWGRRRVLVSGQAVAGALYLAVSLAPVGPHVPWVMVAATFFTNLAQIGHNAMLNDLTNTETRKTAFSLNYLGINLGFSLGPLLAGFLFTANLGLFFALDGLTTWGAAVLVATLTRETLGRPTEGPRATGESHADHRVIRALGERPFFVAFLALSVLGTAVYSQHTFALPLQLRADFSEAGPQVYGWLMAANAVTVVALSTLLTRLTSRWSSLGVVAASAGLYALGFGFSGLFAAAGAPTLGLFFGATVVWTLGEILGSVGGHVYLTAHTPANHRGQFSSIRAMVQTTSQALAAALSGAAIGAWGLGILWPLVAVVALVQGGLLLVLRRGEARRPPPDINPRT